MVLRSPGNGKRTAIYFVFHTEAGLSDVFKNVKKNKNHRREVAADNCFELVKTQACMEVQTTRGHLGTHLVAPCPSERQKGCVALCSQFLTEDQVKEVLSS